MAAVKLVLADSNIMRSNWHKDLFISSFPPDERPPYFFLRWRSLNFVDWWIIKQDSQNVGFFYVIKHKDHVYVIFFAIEQQYRGKGLGTQALKMLLDHYAAFKVFLAIEPIDPSAPNYSERVKRKNFYLRCGLQDLEQHMQELSVVYELLGTKGRVDPQIFVELMQKWIIWPINKLVTIKILD
ncbi:MAG: GNAT family N-acetyltransferase [Desulfovibrionaceae bacterium]|nr:GNAT family N-acetyltransferase [Desulfovibrionaceae bacterium]